ncbi:MAG TPA: hypothetical protein VNV85_14625 [Puia sp.]|jgi:hypothetical protein|nr:hypothetical protein [Puia sp.]
MKKVLTGLAVLFILTSTSSLLAQQGGGQGRMDPAVLKQKLIDSLQLSGLQADSVVAIGQEFRPRMREIFMDQSLSQDDKRSKMGELNQQRNKRIRAVLGDDLFKKYQEWEQRNRPQRSGGGGTSTNR